ncbi:MAG: NepR family anti-sigma factor [Erythrobacter sp.]|uniref:NepR family anti-sigma factor n=1 Tax=Erythrobacter sp. TaxID=1042 RepID=UPI00261F8CF7|nr:NepR family anti-sigma factor [Erythrobacter sp.]MDJ0979242.1 NepR family anti-sigma factor [Erythrobacter sp.]
MSTDASSGDPSPGQRESASGSPRPDWADGLRQLYDSVVDEPLPDAFKDLLDQLDGDETDLGECEADGSGEAQT